MASVAYHQPEQTLPLPSVRDDAQGWGFALLIGTVCTLFLRPADLFPALEAWPIYQFAILCCLAVSARTMFYQLRNRNIVEQPALASLLVLLAAVALSHLSHGFIWAARMSLAECCKVAALYVLIIGLVNTPYRLIKFIQYLTISITCIAALALLDRYDLVSVAAMDSVRDRSVANTTGESTEFIDRIRGTGIFQDPNDFGLILVTGLILSTAFWLRPSAGWLRHFWIVPCGILLGAMALTHSRGAMLSLACAIPAGVVYVRSFRLGLFSLLLVPVLAMVFSARMTDMDAMVEGTGQSRIQIWSDSLAVWKQYPVFGLGEGLLVDELGVVTHNSFLHCFAELGFLGGTAFVACFLAAALGLWQRRLSTSLAASDGEYVLYPIAHYRTYVFAALIAYMAGIQTLSRQFVMPTYLILGLATAALTVGRTTRPRLRVNNHFLFLVLLASCAALLAFYVTIRLFLRR